MPLGDNSSNDFNIKHNGSKLPVHFTTTNSKLNYGLLTSNGKTSIVHYRTLSFFAFRFKKKTNVRFFS